MELELLEQKLDQIRELASFINNEIEEKWYGLHGSNESSMELMIKADEIDRFADEIKDMAN